MKAIVKGGISYGQDAVVEMILTLLILGIAFIVPIALKLHASGAAPPGASGLL